MKKEEKISKFKNSLLSKINSKIGNKPFNPPKILKSSSYKFWKIWIPFNAGDLVLNSAFKPLIESINIICDIFDIVLSSFWCGIIYLVGIYIEIILLVRNSLKAL